MASRPQNPSVGGGGARPSPRRGILPSPITARGRGGGEFETTILCAPTRQVEPTSRMTQLPRGLCSDKVQWLSWFGLGLGSTLAVLRRTAPSHIPSEALLVPFSRRGVPPPPNGSKFRISMGKFSNRLTAIQILYGELFAYPRPPHQVSPKTPKFSSLPYNYPIPARQPAATRPSKRPPAGGLEGNTAAQ